VTGSVVDRLVAASTSGLMLAQAPDYRAGQFSPAEAAEAIGQVNARPDATSYHLLLSLRRNAPEAYEQIAPETRAAVLTDALQTQANLNDFGHLGPGGGYDGPAAQPLVEIGAPAIEPLTALLSDDRPAPLMGSEEATLSHDHSYRRSDFAFRYLSEILGREPEFAPTPAERDPAIAALRAEVEG
jgi:hypothetical protein